MPKWIGNLVAVVLFILSLADLPDQLRTWRDWVSGMSDGPLAWLAGDTGRWLAVIGLLLVLWANNIPGRLFATLRTSRAKNDRTRYSIEELKDMKGVLQEKIAAGTQLSLHAYHECNLSTSSTYIVDLVNLSVDILPDAPFWLTCNVHQEHRKRNAWFGLKLNDICVNRVDGEHVMEDDMNVHIKWLIGSVNRKQIRQLVMEYPRESIRGQFGTDGKAAENIRKISIYGRTDGVMTLCNVLCLPIRVSSEGFVRHLRGLD